MGVIGLAISAFGTGKQVVDSADSNTKTNNLVKDQAGKEQALIDKANAQSVEGEKQKQSSASNTAAAAAIRALRGRQEGEAGTVLTGPQGASSMQPGKTLLGS